MITFISRHRGLIIQTQELINLGGKSSLLLSAFIIGILRPQIISQATNASSLCEMNTETDICAALMKPTEPKRNNKVTGETGMNQE